MKYLFNHSEVSPLSIGLIMIPVSKDLIKDMEIFIRSIGGLQYPIYGGKNSLILRSEYEVLKRKNTYILERGLHITSN